MTKFSASITPIDFVKLYLLTQEWNLILHSEDLVRLWVKQKCLVVRGVGFCLGYVPRQKVLDVCFMQCVGIYIFFNP